MGLKQRTAGTPGVLAAGAMYSLRRRGSGMDWTATVRGALVQLEVPLSVVAALAAGWYYASHETLVVLPAVAALALLLASNPHLRLGFVVFGGLLVFQSSDELTPTKLLYLFGVGAAALGAFVRVSRMSRNRAVHDALPFLRASLVFVLLLAASLLLSFANATPQKLWLRDVAPYVLFAAAPLFAVDAATSLSQRALRRVLVVAGLVGSLAFSAEWLSRRSIVDASSVVGLPTVMLGAALFAYAMAVVLTSQRGRALWLVIATTVFFCYVITGTRSSLLLLAAPLAILFGTRRGMVRRSARLVVALPLVALLIGLGTLSFAEKTSADQQVLSARVELLLNTGDVSDQSYASRRAQGEAAWEAFLHNPLLGIGAGEAIEWRDQEGLMTSGLNIDSPLGYIAKFGLLGLVPLAFLVWSFIQFLRLFRFDVSGTSVARFALIGFAGVFVGWWILGVPFADKGLASGFLLLIALALKELSDGQDRIPAGTAA
jgi:O-antigen ligase